MITVVICDSEPVAITGFQTVLPYAVGAKILAVSSNIEDGIDAVRELSPTLLIVDKALGSQSILDWIAGLRISHATTSVMVWGSSFSEPELLRFLQAGASGVVCKAASVPEIVACVRAAADGRIWTDGIDMHEHGEPSCRSTATLSIREQEVLTMVELGLKNREIAARLGIVTGTVKIHMKHIFQKTGIRGRNGLALSRLRAKGAILSLPEDQHGRAMICPEMTLVGESSRPN